MALECLLIGGVITNAGFHRWLIDQPAVVDARVTTRFLDETDLPPRPAPALAEAALAWRVARVHLSGRHVWDALGATYFTPHRPSRNIALKSIDGEVHEVPVDSAVSARWAPTHVEIDDGTLRRVAASVDLAARSVAVNVDGHTHTFGVPGRSERWAPPRASTRLHARAVVAPFPATVADVLVAPGTAVSGGDPLIVVEAMKMLHTMLAVGPGFVAEVRVGRGEQIGKGQVLVLFEGDDTRPGHDGDDGDDGDDGTDSGAVETAAS